jgi:hypothetical protein
MARNSRSKKNIDAFLLALAERQEAERRAAQSGSTMHVQQSAIIAPKDNPLRRASPVPNASYRIQRPAPVVLAQNSAITVLGIDPGSQCTGWGLVREQSGTLT